MQLSNYSKEYVKEQMDDFREFSRVVQDAVGFNTYSMDTIAILYVTMKLEITRESGNYSGY